jgi:hypothetical protein
MDPVPDPLLLKKSCSAAIQTRDFWICSQELWPLDHRGIISNYSFCELLLNLHEVSQSSQ